MQSVSARYIYVLGFSYSWFSMVHSLDDYTKLLQTMTASVIFDKLTRLQRMGLKQFVTQEWRKMNLRTFWTMLDLIPKKTNCEINEASDIWCVLLACIAGYYPHKNGNARDDRRGAQDWPLRHTFTNLIYWGGKVIQSDRRGSVRGL